MTWGSRRVVCAAGWPLTMSVRGRRLGVDRDEHAELVELRRRLRVAEMENEILRRAADYFARENVLLK